MIVLASLILITFGPSESRWQVVNDGVMGGVSKSRMTLTDEGTGLFEGTLSLENNGGFASVRTMVNEPKLADYQGLEIKVRGDGRTYQLRLRMDRNLDGVAYMTPFETEAETWTTVRLPFAAFEPTFRGRRVPNAPALDPARVKQVSLLLADGTPGAFAIEVEWVRTY